MNIKYLISIILMLSVGLVSAQTLTLQKALQLSEQNSKELKIADAKIREAMASVQEAKNHAYPDLKVSGSYLHLNSANVDLKISTEKEESDANRTPVEVNQAVYGMANVSVPVFSGFRIKNGINAAKHMESAVHWDAENQREMLLQTTVSAYYNLLKAQAAVRLVYKNLQQAQHRVKDFINLEKNGLLARNDLLKAQLQASNVSLALLDAENDEKMAQYNLNLMLGLKEEAKITPDTSFHVEALDPGNLKAWEALALHNRSDYQALLERQEAASANVLVAKGAYWPSLAVTGGYTALKVPDLVTVTNAMNIGLGIQYNIADLYKSGAKVKLAKAQQQQRYWSVLQWSDKIKIEVHRAYQDYQKSLKKIAVYRQAIEQAEENYRITKNKYDNSLASTTDLLDADVSELQAQINYAFAKADALIARSRLQETAGILREQIVPK